MEIYFSAFEIYFQALEIVLLHAAKKFVADRTEISIRLNGSLYSGYLLTKGCIIINNNGLNGFHGLPYLLINSFA